MNTDPYRPFPREFEAVCTRAANAIALRSEQENLSYGELNARADAIAGALIAAGLKHGDCVGVCLDRSVTAIAAMLGILKAGGAFVPLDPDFPPERLRFMAWDAAIGLLLTGEAYRDRFSGLEVSILIAEELSGSAPSPALPELSGDDTAYIMYTSGSTGNPKGVQISHRALMTYCRADIEAYQVTDADCTLQFSTLNFDISIEEIFPPLLAGGSVAIRPQQRSDARNELSTLIARFGVTAVHIATAYWHEWVDLMAATGERVPDSIRLMVVTGEKVSVAHYRKWLSLTDHEVLWANAYGPTEATVSATVFVPPPGWDGEAMPIGKALPGYTTRILDAQMQEVAPGETGELWIGGPALSAGYLNRPDLNVNAFITHSAANGQTRRLYKTGDLARYLPDGNIDYAGRIDHQIKIGSFRVEPGEIEEAINAHPQVREALVIGEEEAGKKRIVAYVAQDTDSLSITQLHDWLGQHLPPYMLPSVYVPLERFEKTINGKIDRRALPPSSQGELPASAGYSAPVSATEQALAAIWQTAFGVGRIGIHDDFFALGGNSLMVTQVLARTYETFGTAPGAQAFYANPTIAAQSALLDRHEEAQIRPVPADRPLPLTPEQTQLYYQQQLYSDVTIYNLYEAVRLRGPLDTARLQSALQTLTARHDIFHACLIEQNGHVLQKFDRPAEIELQAERIDNPADLQDWLHHSVYAPFRLKEEVPFRFALARTAEDEHVLALTIHHLFADGWSMALLLRELRALYEQRQETMSEQRHSFADYAGWRAANDHSKTIEEQTSWWCGKLAGLTPLELPQALTPPPQRQWTAQELRFSLPAPLCQAIERFAAEHKLSHFHVLLAAFNALLYRYTQQDDLTVAIAHSGRSHQAFNNTVGNFVRTLMARTQLTGEENFRALAETVKTTCLEAFAHQDAPLSAVVSALRPERSENSPSLSPVLFLMQDIPDAFLSLAGLECETLPIPNVSSDYDLVFEITQTGKTYQGRITFATERFNEVDMQVLPGHFIRLLSAALDDPARRVRHLPWLSEEEQTLTLQHYNRTARDYPAGKGVEDLIRAQAARSPERIAVRCGDQALSYAELTGMADQLAGWLRDQGAGPGTLIGVCMERHLYLPVSLLAIMRCGAAYLPMDPEYPAERVAYILGDAKAPLLLTDAHLEADLPQTGARHICPERDWATIAAATPFSGDNSAGPADLAYVIYTSGSTGKPKGVMLTRQNVSNFICSMQQTPGMDENDRLLAVTTISFDIAVLELYLPLVCGAMVDIVPRDVAIDGRRLAARLREQDISIMQATPATWRMLLETDWTHRPGFKALIGGEALPRDLIAPLLEKVDALWNMYGPTETTVWSTCVQVTDADAPITIGTPIANTKIYILGPDDQPCPVNVPGELCIGGDGVARGYANREDLTAEKFVADPFAGGDARMYRTGDSARWRHDGQLEYISRLDNQIKLRGYRIELGEIESVLATHPAVAQAVVMVRKDANGSDNLAAWLIGKDANRPDNASLREHLAQSLPDYMIPAAYSWLEKMPQTPNGKIDRKALPEPVWAAPQTAGAQTRPRSEAEKQLATLWQELLGHADFGIHDNFFAAGGHSLLAMRLIVRVQELTGKDLPVRAVMNRDLAGLAALIAPEQQISGEHTSRMTHQPMYFGEGDGRLYGVYHAPAGAATPRAAVLLCQPFGHEYMRTHRSLRLLADKLAGLGFAVLRFDYRGTGDSAGNSEHVTFGQLERDTALAADTLRELSKRKKLSVVGVRHGAYLTPAAGADGRVVLWDPVTDGRAALKAWRKLNGEALADLDRYRFKQHGDSDTELLGYHFSTALLGAIGALTAPNLPDTPQTTVVVSGDTPDYRFREATVRAVPDTQHWDSLRHMDDILLAWPAINAIVEALR
ncbi:amino acid adenylation domain-containing protein [Granulosicoccaceae sp. 1_MG-2023]|nr:amino acid adenylation domain-containing protein [Granulosicoccaceae sp. 1_MG-2023]